PANGERANQWLVGVLVGDFAPSAPGAPTLDAIELDSTKSTAPARNTKGALENLDCDGDGLVDYCQDDVGTAQQADAYGIGYDQPLGARKAGLAVYDTDPTQPPKMLLGDGEIGLRSIEALNGAEFESFPSWDDYTYSSSALATFGTWQDGAGAAGDHLSYAYT